MPVDFEVCAHVLDRKMFSLKLVMRHIANSRMSPNKFIKEPQRANCSTSFPQFSIHRGSDDQTSCMLCAGA